MQLQFMKIAQTDTFESKSENIIVWNGPSIN